MTTRPNIVLCVEDLKKIIPHFTKEMLSTHEEDMTKLLRNLGFDTSLPITYQEQLMSVTKLCGTVVTDRIVGNERVDPWWTRSGNASTEAKDYTEDYSLQQELGKMKRSLSDAIYVIDEKDADE